MSGQRNIAPAIEKGTHCAFCGNSNSAVMMVQNLNKCVRIRIVRATFDTDSALTDRRNEFSYGEPLRYFGA